MDCAGLDRLAIRVTVEERTAVRDYGAVTAGSPLRVRSQVIGQRRFSANYGLIHTCML